MTLTLSTPRASTAAPGVSSIAEYNLRDFPGAVLDGATDMAAVIQSAMATISAAGGGSLVIPGAVAVASNLAPPSNVRIRGVGRRASSIKAIGGCTSVFLSALSLTGFSVEDITLDGNNQASCLLLTGGGHQDIAVRRARAINFVQNGAIQSAGNNLGWGIAIGSAAVASTGVEVVDTIVGPGVPFYEACILINCDQFTVRGCTFRNLSTALVPTGLAIYAYCTNGTIAGCTFEGIGAGGGGANTGIDCYIQQSDTITYTGNVHKRSTLGSCLQIYNVRDLDVAGCAFHDTSGAASAVGVVIIDTFDTAALNTFNGNASLYPYTKDVRIDGCDFDGHDIGIQLYGGVFTSSQVNTNSFKNITVSGCDFDNFQHWAVQVGGAGAQNIQRVGVYNCRANGMAFAGAVNFVVSGNVPFSGVTTTQVIAANASKQSVAVSSIPAGLTAGEWVQIDTAGNAEDCYVFAAAAGHITIIATKAHASGVAVAPSATIVGLGVSDVTLQGNKGTASTVGASYGISISSVTGVLLLENDMRFAFGGGGVPISVTNGGTIYAARNNAGINPQGAAVATPAVPATTVAQVNNTFSDCQVSIVGGTVTVVSVTDALGANPKTLATSSPCLVIVPAGASITLTYSVAPTWAWYGL